MVSLRDNWVFFLFQQTGGEEAEVNLETCVPLPEEENSAPLSLTAFKGELDSAVTQYLTQVKDLGYKEESRDQKLLEVKFKLDPQEIRPKVKEEIKDTRPRVKVISREDKGEQTELEVELPSLDNPLYLTLSECSSGELPLEHFYENGQITDDEHIYENVENSTGDEDEEHLYDTLPRHKPDLPPKPDFLAQLAARQSEPVKRAWNPFVSLSVETGDPTPPLSTASSLSSPDSHASSDRLEDASPRRSVGSTNPFLASVPRETSEQTLILDGSETSDLGSSGGEEDSGSVEDWPLPPTPPPGEDAVIVEDHPLPPPPPELALQELEEEVIREEEEERKLALQREKEAIEREYGALRFQDPDFREEESDKVEAVNANLALLERNFEDSSDTESTARRESTAEKERKLTLSKETQPEAKKEVKRELKKETEREFKREAKTEVKSSADEKKSKREAKVVPLDGDSEEFDTPAIRHSVIIELKDSCPSVPQSLKPSEIRRKESLKRSESLKRTGILERIETQRKLERRESFCKLFPKLATSLQSRPEDHGSSVSVGVKSPKKEDPAFSFLNVPSSAADQVIEISEDGSWEMKETSMDSDVAAHANPDIDPFTGNPIMAPPLSPAAIAAPPLAFQTDDGMDGVYSANIVSTHSGPSSLASASTDSLGTLTSLQADASAQLSTPETILEEILPAPLVESRSEVEARQQLSPKRSQEEPQQQAKNLGAAIMKGYEQDLMKKKESMNLPEHSLLEFGDSVRDLEEQRRSVIKQMTVKAKRKDTWIKTFSMHAHGDESSIPVAPSRCRRKNSPSRDALEAGKVTQFAKKVDEIEKETTVRTPPKTSPKKEDLPKEEPAVPPKAPEKRKKVPKRPEDIPPAPEPTPSENVYEESVISPKNTEALAAFFSSPAKAPKANEPTSSPTDSPKKSQAKPAPIDEPDSAAEGPAAQEQVAPPMPEATTFFLDESTVEDAEATVEAAEEPIAVVESPEILPATETSVLQEEEEQEKEAEEEEEEDSMVKEKNEINKAHCVFPKEDAAPEAEEIPEEKEVEEDAKDYTEAVPLAPQSTSEAEDKGSRGEP